MGNAREHHRLRAQAEEYYTRKFADHGATAAGVDWNGEESQRLRFRQLLRVAAPDEPLALIDYGSGYGALAEYLQGENRTFRYVGYDISKSMIEHARNTFAGRSEIAFVDNEDALEPLDYAVASGIFNVKLDTDDGVWREYVEATIARLASLGRRGFAFNLLTSYSDPERMREDLYYGDPAAFFDLCRRTHAQWVSLLHGYGLWEFTIVARREPLP